MFKKVIYKKKYEELMKNFENIVKNNVPFSHIRTNYNGWSQLLNRLEKPDCKKIEYGNLSYFICVFFKFLNDNFERAEVYLTDTGDDCKESINAYYQINIYYKDGILQKDFIKCDEYKRDVDGYKIILPSCDFYYFNDNFIIVTRDDKENLYYLFCFGEDSQETLNSLLDGVKLDKFKSSLLDDLKYFYDDYIFANRADQDFILEIGKMVIDAIKTNNFDEVNKILEKNIIYTSNDVYGFEDYSGIQKICDEIVGSKQILDVKMKYKVANEKNEMFFLAKFKTSDDKIKNKAFLIRINHNKKIYYMEETMPWLYGIPEFEEK